MSFQAYLDNIEKKTGKTPGPQISDKHVGSGGTHGDESNVLHLDGKKNR